MTVSNPLCGCSPTPRRCGEGGKLGGARVVEEQERRSPRRVVYEKTLRTGKPSPTQWRWLLRWMKDSFFMSNPPEGVFAQCQ